MIFSLRYAYLVIDMSASVYISRWNRVLIQIDSFSFRNFSPTDNNTDLVSRDYSSVRIFSGCKFFVNDSGVHFLSSMRII